MPRKFRFPVCEDAHLVGGRPQDIYDELQYCQESDIEEVTRSKVPIDPLEERASSLDLDRKKKLEASSDTFSRGSEDGLSVYSSPRHKIQKELLAYDRVMPFDFYTQRKAKKFFKEDIPDIDTLLHNQNLSLRKEAQREKSHRRGSSARIIFDEDEDSKLKEVPELNERLKKMYALKP